MFKCGVLSGDAKYRVGFYLGGVMLFTEVIDTSISIIVISSCSGIILIVIIINIIIIDAS